MCNLEVIPCACLHSKLCPVTFSLSQPSIVLDLDETIVFSSPIPPQTGEYISVRVNRRRLYVRFRPGLSQFLAELSNIYQIYFFTASSRDYANPIIEYILPSTPPECRLFREDCTCYGGYSVKDLSQLGLDLERVILVDDIGGSGLFQPYNLIRISPWSGEVEDDTLSTQLLPLLKSLADVENIPNSLADKIEHHSYPCLSTF